jgi:predicted RNA-binding Zn-ribbon protein involved in translation (DUF1610 family)
VTELERFFRQIVRNLAATDPARLHRPLPLADIRDSIVPYRANRRALQLESSEDYELVLMQLCAGEGGFARTEPDDIRALFAAELRSANPDLGLLHQHENAVVSLESKQLTRALDPQPDLTFAPPEPDLDLPAGKPPLGAEPWAEPSAARPGHCGQCGGVLPTRRLVKFCPHCGWNQLVTRCPACQSELEAGWRHCITCGFLVA